MVILPETLWQTSSDRVPRDAGAQPTRCYAVITRHSDRMAHSIGIAFAPHRKDDVFQALSSPLFQVTWRNQAPDLALHMLHLVEPPTSATDARLTVGPHTVQLERRGLISADRRSIHVPAGKPGLVYSFVIGFFARLELDQSAPRERGVPVHAACFGIEKRSIMVVGSHRSGKTTALVSGIRLAHSKNRPFAYTSDDWCTLHRHDNRMLAHWPDPWIRVAGGMSDAPRNRVDPVRRDALLAPAKEHVDLAATEPMVRHRPHMGVRTTVVIDAIDTDRVLQAADRETFVDQTLLYSSHLPLDRSSATFAELREALRSAWDRLEVFAVGQDRWLRHQQDILATLLLPE